MAYRYRALTNPKEIRLMRLLPCPPSDAAQPDIACEILHANLDHEPEYEALSYVWGSTLKPFAIKADGKKLAVTSNLYIALQFLRGDLQEPKTYWIDSICIDQSSGLERNHQVSMMKDIFSQAARTTVWLGDMSFDSISPHWTFFAILQFKGRPPEDPWVDLTNDQKSSWYKSVRKLLRSPWFTRIWIVQELACSKEVHVRAGDNKILWEDLVAAMRYLDRDGIRDKLGFTMRESGNHRRQFSEFHHNLLVLDRTRKRYQRDSECGDLLYLIFDLVDFNATEELDQVYALAGIASQRSGSNASLPIDYKQTWKGMVTSLFDFHASQYRHEWHKLLREAHLQSDSAFNAQFKHTHWIIRPNWNNSAKSAAYELGVNVIGECSSSIGWLRLVHVRGVKALFLLSQNGDDLFDIVDIFRMSDDHHDAIERAAREGFDASIWTELGRPHRDGTPWPRPFIIRKKVYMSHPPLCDDWDQHILWDHLVRSIQESKNGAVNRNI